MTRKLLTTRRTFLQGTAATGLLLAAPPVIGQAGPKVAGIHGSPVENAWNSRLHGAMVEAAAEGKIAYVFSEGVAGTDYVRAMREYAESGVDLIVGEVYPVEAEAREAAEAARLYAAEECGFTRLISQIHPENGRSISLALRLGAVQEEAAELLGEPCLIFRHPDPRGAEDAA